MMRVTGWLGLAMCVAAGVARAEMVSVVQITDMRGLTAFEVMSREEYAAIQKEIKEEMAVYQAAAADAKKEWDANKENKLPFQGNRIKPRSVKKVGADFSDREKADKRKAQLEERAAEKQLEEMEKESKKKKGKESEDDIAKEEARVKAYDDAFAMISKRMGDKLGRPVPSIGFAFEAAPEKGGDAKKDDKKADKKDEKKAGGH
ncbi:MAG TPA: hypothetical protein PLW27_10350 [Kiritimatiellia bacterium]|jgi:hypothetical protein|nr:hypothetical protein [Kiritimatiellia bacterium]